MSPKTSLLPWGEHLSWDVILDVPISGGDEMMHEFARPWVLWDRCFALAPEASAEVRARAVGASDRQSRDRRVRPACAVFRARPGGREGLSRVTRAFYIGTWCYAWKHTQDEMFLRAIETLLARFERKRVQKDGSHGCAPSGRSNANSPPTMVPDPLASRLRAFAAKEDELILPDLQKAAARRHRAVRRPPKWQTGYSAGTLAHQAMFCLARHEQTGKPAYRDLLVAIADRYLDSQPEEDVDAWPMSFAHAISTQVAAHRFTKKAGLSRAGAAVRADGGGAFLAGQSAAAREQADRALRNHHRRRFARAGAARSPRRDARPDDPDSVEHDRPMNFRRIASATVCMLVFTICVRSAEIPKAPVPPSPFLKVVYSYADALLKHGRDQFGEKHTGLFLSALDRTTLQPLRECPPPPAGLDPAIRAGRRRPARRIESAARSESAPPSRNVEWIVLECRVSRGSRG